MTVTAYRTYVRFHRSYSLLDVYILPEHVCVVEEATPGTDNKPRTEIHLIDGHHYEVAHTALDVIGTLRGTP